MTMTSIMVKNKNLTQHKQNGFFSSSFKILRENWNLPVLNLVHNCAAIHKLWFSNRTTALSLSACVEFGCCEEDVMICMVFGEFWLNDLMQNVHLHSTHQRNAKWNKKQTMALIIIAATTLMMNWFQRNCQEILRFNQPHANTHYTFVINFFSLFFFVILFSLFFF